MHESVIMHENNNSKFVENVCTAKDAPPSYYDVMGISQMRNDIGAAKEEANNPAIMIFRVCCICIGSRKRSHLSSVIMLSCVFCISVMHWYSVHSVWSSTYISFSRW